MEEKSFDKIKEIKIQEKPVKKCLCNKTIGRNERCPDHGDIDKI